MFELTCVLLPRVVLNYAMTSRQASPDSIKYAVEPMSLAGGLVCLYLPESTLETWDSLTVTIQWSRQETQPRGVPLYPIQYPKKPEPYMLFGTRRGRGPDVLGMKGHAPISALWVFCGI